MKRSGLVSQGTVTRLRETARAAFERGDLKNCVDILVRACRLAPADPGILLQLGRMQGLRYDYNAAEEAFDKAVRIAPTHRKAEALAGAGQQARDFYNPEIAEKYFKRAVAEKGATPDMLVKMAEFCERRRQMEQAASLVDQALHIDSSCPPALLARGRLAHRAGKLEEAEQSLSPLLELSINPEVHVRAGYEIGSVLDRQGRYDEAMSAFLGAKALLRQDGAPQYAQLRAVRAHLAQMRAEITPEVLERWSVSGHELQPPCRLSLLGGHPRSGTTLLEQVLDSHPDIVSAEETSHFSEYVYLPLKRQWPEITPMLKVLSAASSEALVSLRNDYLQASESCLGTTLAGRLLIDKNPSLTFMVPAIARAFPESKFLIASRDPRDVVLSCFMQPFVPVHRVSSSYLNLETAAEEYAALMGTWRTIAPMLRNPWLEVRYEDMVDDLESVARKTLEFLGMPWDDRVLGFDEHARSKLVRSPTYSDVTQKVFKRARGRWRNYQKYLEPHLHILEPFVKAFGYE